MTGVLVAERSRNERGLSAVEAKKTQKPEKVACFAKCIHKH